MTGARWFKKQRSEGGVSEQNRTATGRTSSMQRHGAGRSSTRGMPARVSPGATGATGTRKAILTGQR